MQTTSGDNGLSSVDFFLGLVAFCIEPCMVFPIDGVVGLPPPQRGVVVDQGPQDYVIQLKQVADV